MARRKPIDPDDQKTWPLKPPYQNNIVQLDTDANRKDTSRFLKMSLALNALPPVSLRDPDAVKERLNLCFKMYLDAGMKPTVAGMALSLGINRTTLSQINSGNYGNTGGLRNLPAETTNTVKRAYFLLETMWEDYMLNGQINPVSGIFLGKNNFGYRDQVDYQINSGEVSDSVDSATIRKKYLSDSDSVSDSDSDSPDSAPTMG